MVLIPLGTIYGPVWVFDGGGGAGGSLERSDRFEFRFIVGIYDPGLWPGNTVCPVPPFGSRDKVLDG